MLNSASTSSSSAKNHHSWARFAKDSFKIISFSASCAVVGSFGLSTGLAGLTTLGGYIGAEWLYLKARKSFGPTNTLKAAAEFMQEVQQISGYTKSSTHQHQDLDKIIKSIQAHTNSVYTSLNHIQNAHLILIIIDAYIEHKTSNLAASQAVQLRQSLFCELVQGGHFVFEDEQQAQRVHKSAQKGLRRASSHYKEQKFKQIESEKDHLVNLLRTKSIRLFSDSELELLKIYGKYDFISVESIDGQWQKQAEFKVKQTAAASIKSLSKTDGLSNLAHIDTDFSISAGQIFREFLMAKVQVKDKSIVWGQLEGHSHHRDPSIEGPVSSLFNSVMNIVSLKGTLFSYNANKLGHHIDFIKYWWNNKTRNVGQYGTSSMTEKAYLQSIEQSNFSVEVVTEALKETGPTLIVSNYRAAQPTECAQSPTATTRPSYLKLNA